MSPRNAIEDYYEALRRGEPLYPYFVESDATTKVGIRETLKGYDEVAEGLFEQSRSTEDWSVTSRDLHVHEREAIAVFSDRVDLEWTDREVDTVRSYDTRWTGTLERSPTPSRATGDDRPPIDRGSDEWRFLTMHVSAPREW